LIRAQFLVQPCGCHEHPHEGTGKSSFGCQKPTPAPIRQPQPHRRSPEASKLVLRELDGRLSARHRRGPRR
jgi:hypothetical protein